MNIGPQPADCKVREPHATLSIGADPISLLKLERKSVNRANDRVERCYQFREDQAKALR